MSAGTPPNIAPITKQANAIPTAPPAAAAAVSSPPPPPPGAPAKFDPLLPESLATAPVELPPDASAVAASGAAAGAGDTEAGLLLSYSSTSAWVMLRQQQWLLSWRSTENCVAFRKDSIGQISGFKRLFGGGGGASQVCKRARREEERLR